jgi:hypothetical protein
VAAIGAVRLRRDAAGALRAYVKISRGVWRARALIVYEESYGPVPAGCVIHHRDRDSLNDAPGNLVAISRAAHAAEHAYSRAVLEQQANTLSLALEHPVHVD